MADSNVDTYHLNIGVGDCTILIKSEITERAVSGGTRAGLQPVSIVLVDGGNSCYESRQGAWGRIQEFMEQTLPLSLSATRYANLNIAVDCKFESIVITHWDQE